MTERAETIDSLRVHVRRCLDKLNLGLFFTEYGLPETVQLIPDGVNAEDLEKEGLMDKKCAFQVFLKAVASEIVKDKGVTKGKKKRSKDYLEILQAFSGEWVDYIRKNMRKKQQAKMNKLSMMGTQDTTGDSSTTALKKKGKRGPRGPYKKRKQPAAAAAASPATSTPSPTKKKKMPPVDIETARKEFEAEKEEVMSKVPNKNKKLFNQVGFAKWGKQHLPAMALDPFNVPPGDIRDQWMKMFQNVVEKDRISKMGHLVWWIGPQTDGQGSYSVVPSHGFMSYEEGEKKGMHELPSKIKKMLDRGAELSKTQMETVEVLRILNELALQPKEEREHPRSDFQEEDYWGLDDDEEFEGDGIRKEDPDMEVDDDDDEDELIDDEEDLMDYSQEQLSKKSKKKGKKRKKDDIILEEDDNDGGDEEMVYDDDMDNDLAPPKKKKKKKDKMKLEKVHKKKKKKSLEGVAGDGGTADTSEGREFEKQDAGMDTAPPARELPDEALLDAASVESADSALEDSDYGEGAEEADDPLGPLVDGDSTSKKQSKLKKKKVGRPRKSETVSKDDADEKKAKKKKNKERKEPKKRTKAQEQRDLEKCEEEYLPFIENLSVAREAKDIASIQEVLESLLPVAESFTASFFSEYDIPKIMKQTKAVLEDANADTSTYRKLWNSMKTSYNTKVKELPEGFKPKRRKIVKAEPTIRDANEVPSERETKVKEEDAKIQAPLVRSNEAAESVTVKTEPTDADVASPSMKIPGKEGKRRTSASSDQLLKTAEKSSAAKPKPKKFSVLDFMSKKKDNSKRLSAGGGAGKSSSAPTSSGSNKKSTPAWVTSPLPSDFDSFLGSDNREDRSFALEFLLQAAAHFPPNKGVNEDSVARNLETAIYEWSQDQLGTWNDIYWDKVHALVAAITGKRDIGTLVQAIMEGEFQTPKALMKLSTENLENSFDGRPLLLND